MTSSTAAHIANAEPDRSSTSFRDPVVARFLSPVTADAPPADADPSLTPRQAAFADAYARAPNGAAAARKAGYARGSAKVAAARNLRRSGVLMRIMARRREQALAREAQRARIAGLLDEALAFARARENPHALARIAALLMRLDGLYTVSPADDQLLAAATEDQLQELLACYEIAHGGADPELPDPGAATVEELAARAGELMQAARDRARALPGVRVADDYLDGLMDHLEQGVRGAADACAFARLLDEAAGADDGAASEPCWNDDDAPDAFAETAAPAPKPHPPLGGGSKAARAGADAFGEGSPASRPGSASETEPDPLPEFATRISTSPQGGGETHRHGATDDAAKITKDNR